MAKAIIHYFTGTGNSYRAARVIAGSLGGDGYEVDLVDIERMKSSHNPAEALNIFLFPVYATALPLLMERYLKRLPTGNGAKAAVIAIFGELDLKKTIPGYEGRSPQQGAGILKGRGYDVILTDGVGYPVNWSTIGATPSSEESPLLQEDGDKTIRERVIPNLLEERRALKKISPLQLCWTFLFGLAYNIFGRHFYGKLRVSGDDCNGCGICAKVCPAGVIKMQKGHPRWRINCLGCERCINICPKNAIYTSLVRVGNTIISALLPLIFIPFTYSSLSNLLSPYLPAPAAVTLDIVILVIIISLISLLLYAPLDLLITHMEHLRALKALFQAGYNKKSARYIEPFYRKELIKNSR